MIQPGRPLSGLHQAQQHPPALAHRRLSARQRKRPHPAEALKTARLQPEQFAAPELVAGSA